MSEKVTVEIPKPQSRPQRRAQARRQKKKKRNPTPGRRAIIVAPPPMKGFDRNFDPRATLKLKRRKRFNPYLATIVDPAQFKGVRYPDPYVRETGMLHQFQQKKVPFIPALMNPLIDTPGEYYCIFRPSMVHPFWMYGLYPNSDQPVWLMAVQNDRFGVRNLVDSDVSVANQDSMPFIAKGTLYNLACAQIFQSKNYVDSPMKRILTDGTIIYGYTWCVGNAHANNTIKVQITTNGPVTNTTDSIDIIFTNMAGATVTLNIAATSIDQTSWSGTTATIDTLMLDTGLGATVGFAAGRQNPIGIRIRYNSATAQNKGLSITSFTCKQNTQAGPTQQLGLFPVDWDDQAANLQDFSLYRTVSASLWCAYQGSDLSNGGGHAAVMYAGGEHPWITGIYDYSTLCSSPNRYEDKMKVGSYSYWYPSSTTHSEMMPCVNDKEWVKPYMVAAGIVSDLTQPQPMRAQFVANYEFVSNSQRYEYASVRRERWMIYDVENVLFNAPTSMSNDGHWSTIFKWLKSAGEDTIAFAKDNAHWLGPLASGLGRAAISLL